MPLAADPTLHPAIARANQAEAEGQGISELWAWAQDNPPLALARLQDRHAQVTPGSPEALFRSAVLMQANLEAGHVEGDDSDSIAFTVWCTVEMREECTAGDADARDSLASPPRPLADAEHEWQARHFLELWAAWTEKAEDEPAG